ncbi:MAG: protein-L-isoaspartate O-methyltransferase [bacterium]|nr:protein-L-isoaspartate O-methyltransferase [bacterium]
MEKLVEELKRAGVLKTPRIIKAFRAINRRDFVPHEHKNEAYYDIALPTKEGQTVSQPYTVAFMLELLQGESGNKIMDVGSGSGWQTALLAYIVGPKGKVFGIELIPEIKKMGDENIAKYNFIKKGIVVNLQMSAENGLPQEAPFDRIISGASAQEIPSAWKEQLAVGGRIVMPIRESVWLFVKNGNGTFDEREFPGFAFVPFVTDTNENHQRCWWFLSWRLSSPKREFGLHKFSLVM